MGTLNPTFTHSLTHGVSKKPTSTASGMVLATTLSSNIVRFY